ncbi:MAG: hypothetical protein DRN30_02530 [Thermoplasmata archaeon]|nr:hypothetical protein [Euryarchaeota archaeon]RLF66224.1 MAG: hypothetical protein DRN30_02530 [Thermoplasmata archaeon]
MGLLDIFTKRKSTSSQRQITKPRRLDYLDLSAFQAQEGETASKRMIYVIKNPREDPEDIKSYFQLALQGHVVLICLPRMKEDEYLNRLGNIYKDYKNVLESAVLRPPGGRRESYATIQEQTYFIICKRSEYRIERLS